ncbi:amidohydrolase family protein [Actinoplanes sp. M2I2]|uniref:amidohydrolase family protein n=1 Tax=Actinoplanes sp. M2I2 TaxID=1734444 RepID=UPI0020210848|nr:amidohydrolase family protein [Actinoplanes sp. M2I2]
MAGHPSADRASDLVDPVTYDLVIAGGRVIDPETGLDGVRDVGIVADRIAAVSQSRLTGRRRIDARGLVVAPGFIDLHSHGQAVGECRLQALDGVTTALELEAGVAPVSVAYTRAAEEGRPINYGYSASWSALRMHVIGGVPLFGGTNGPLDGLGSPGWRAAASPARTAVLLDMLRGELADGALGIGVLLGYAPEIDPAEFVEVARLAAEAGVPVFTHARPLVEQDPGVVVDGAGELTRVAAETGVHMHYCHVNSTSTRHLDRVQSLVEAVRAEGARVTSEVYPYGSGMSSIGSDYFRPDRLHILGATGTPQDVVYARTGETVASVDRLLELRATDPSGLAFITMFADDRPVARLAQMFAFPQAVIASDAVPFVVEDGREYDPLQWPPPAFVRTHPRGAGTYGRTLRMAVRETGLLSLAETIAKCSLEPARIVAGVAPAMRRKGRIQPGCDADVVVFDAERVTDTATYQHSVRPSTGFAHVIVNGEPVVSDGRLQQHAFPGRPVRGRR